MCHYFWSNFYTENQGTYLEKHWFLDQSDELWGDEECGMRLQPAEDLAIFLSDTPETAADWVGWESPTCSLKDDTSQNLTITIVPIKLIKTVETDQLTDRLD